MSRPTLAQIESLVEFLEQNPGVAKGFLRTNQAKMETKRKWATVATTLNSLGGANIDGQGWAKYWTEKKCALKKLCTLHRSSMRRTGGGPPDNLASLSELDRRLVAVMGGQEFAFGDPQIAVNPFPQSSQPVQMTPPPSSLAALSEDTNYNLVVEQEVVLPICTSPVAGTSRDAHMQTPPPDTISESQPQRTSVMPRQRRSLPSRMRENADMERLAQIEERRVNAENITAQALADVAAAFQRNAVALENISNAIENIANAMAQIARALEGFTRP